LADDSPTLFTLYHGSKVRHLLIEGNDPGSMSLGQLIDGVHTIVATGTQHEMDKKAQTIMTEWQREGFNYKKDGGPPAFEPLKHAVALAMLMGYTKVVDPKCKHDRNLLGQVPLASWQGWKDKSGADYEYGFTGSTLYGQPKVTAKHGVNMTPRDNAEFLATLKKVIEIRKALGDGHEFLLI
jgi:hypothetical protein